MGIKERYLRLYDFFEEIPVIGRIFRAYFRRFEMLFYGDKTEISYLTVRLIGKILLIVVISFCLLFGLNPSLYTFLTALLIIYILSAEITAKDTARLNIRFLKALDEFISNIKHYYYQDGAIREAVCDAINASVTTIKGHGTQLYDCICAEDRDQAITVYMNAGYHKYLKLLLSLCVLVEENGDICDEDGSVFLNSLMKLRSDVLEDIRYIEDRRHRFAGLSLTAGLPVIAVPYIAIWGADTIPSLYTFYFGYTGMLLKLLLLCITFICYNAVFRLREGDEADRRKHFLAEKTASLFPFCKILDLYIERNYTRSERMADKLKRLCDKYSVKTLYMIKLLWFFTGMLALLIICAAGHYENRIILCEDVSDVSNLSTFADGRQISAMERVIPQYVGFYTENEIYPDEAVLEVQLLSEQGIRTDEIAAATAKEIMRRVNLYNSEKMNLFDLLLSLLFGFCCFFYPSLVISFRLLLTENRMQDEVMQFQSLIHMLKKVPGISSMDILEKMEIFAEIFKPAIRQCINEFSISDIEAFERLYSNEQYAGFRKIVDCFMMVDEMGIEDAFEEISSEIVNFKENRKLERKILLDNEGMLGSLIAILPGGLIVFGYLLCPFMIRSVQIFNSYQSELTQLAR